jgi:hypothetical protein
MMKKKCSSCLIEKDIIEFHKHNREKDGLFYQCKECRKVISKKNYHNNKQNKKIVITGKTCSVCLIEKDVNEFHRQIGTKDGFRSICKECRSDKFKYDYKINPKFKSTHKVRTEQYRIKNREKINGYFKKRYLEKPHEYAWRGMLKYVIRRFGTKKEKNTHEVLGYSSEEFKKHFEKLFEEGMSWENWGEWHIDHKIPISYFNKSEDPKKVNSLDNLQPLWAIENIKKSNKLNESRD